MKKLVIFVRAPRPGSVKTRLAATLGGEAACAVYRRLVGGLLEQLADLDALELRFTPDDAEADVRPWLRSGWTLAPQGAGDLGARLHRAFESARANGAERVVLIGSDCPDVSAADVDDAWEALRSHDVVLGPARDGGYWLIGMNEPRAELFEGIPWSTDAVFAQTVARCRNTGLRVRVLRQLDDIDTEADWRRFVSRTQDCSTEARQ